MRLIMLIGTSAALANVALASDGVLEINQTCAVQTGCFGGDTAGFPVTITSSGSYRLTSNLDVSLGYSGINVSASDVAIDLGGFTLRRSLSAGTFEALYTSEDRVSVSNGSIVGFEFGVSLLGNQSHIEGLRIGVKQKGIRAGFKCLVVRNGITNGSDTAIDAGNECVVEGNTTSSNGNGPSLVAGAKSIIRGNTVSGVDGGIISSNSVVTGNIASATLDGPAIGVLGGGVISDNYASSPDGIGPAIAAENAIVSNNRVTGAQVGIRCSDCSVVGNVVSAATGVALDATGGAGTTGYQGNQFNGNNGGNANPQVLGGIETGPNVCGGDLICP